MDMESLKHRLSMVRNAEFNAHAQRMCVIGYIGAMLEMNKITWPEYDRITTLAVTVIERRNALNLEPIRHGMRHIVVRRVAAQCQAFKSALQRAPVHAEVFGSVAYRVCLPVFE